MLNCGVCQKVKAAEEIPPPFMVMWGLRQRLLLPEKIC
jgi:hypothetical protein